MSASRRGVVLPHLVKRIIGDGDHGEETLAPINREIFELFGLQPGEVDFHLVEERARTRHASHHGVQEQLDGEQSSVEHGRDLVFRCHPFISGKLSLSGSNISLYHPRLFPVAPRSACPGEAA